MISRACARRVPSKARAMALPTATTVTAARFRPRGFGRRFAPVPVREMSVWSSFKDSFKNKFASSSPKREIVGKDNKGNTYYHMYVNPGEPPRRMVDYEDDFPDSSSMPRLWYSWLRYNIDKAPTEEECLADEAAVQQLAQRVKEINEKDARLRMQEMAERRANGEEEAHDMSVKDLIGQMERSAK